MRLRAALFPLVVATTVAIAAGAPANAAVPGFDVTITEVPNTFAAGARPDTVTVVASTDVAEDCQKVRWSMLMSLDGVDLDEVRVARIEGEDSFPLQVQAEGDTARLTDAEADPGELCRGRTVTARYQVAFTEDAGDGRVTFQAEAYDSDQRLLQQAQATSQVVDGADGDEPVPGDTGEPDPSPTVEESTDGSAGEVDPDDQTSDPAAPTGEVAAAAVARQGTTSMLGVGLIIGALLVFLGVGLLLRVRMRARHADGVDTHVVAPHPDHAAGHGPGRAPGRRPRLGRG